MSLISGILSAIKSKKKLVLVDNFLTDINNGSMIQSSKIFDFSRMNKDLSKYNIQVMDVYDVHNTTLELSFNYYFNWINNDVKDSFKEFTKYIKFNQKYYELAQNTISNLGTTFNTIHLRTEEDAINHWSKQNRMTTDQFKTSLEEIYIEKIGLHFTKSIPILLLTSDTNSPIVNYLKDQGYTYYITDKVLKGREVNAIVDLILGSQTTNHFIGNFNNELLRGSSFSYSILQLLKPTCIYTSIDLDKLHGQIDINLKENMNKLEDIRPSFHILIACGGRKTLQRLLESVMCQLEKDDAITIVFDGDTARAKSGYSESWITNSPCTIFTYDQIPNIGAGIGSEPVRSKYQSQLEKITTYIMHADDDDIYLPGAFYNLRHLCKDPNNLYIAKMDNIGTIVPSKKSIEYCNIGTPNGIIPFSLANTVAWGPHRGGDFTYYNALQHKVKAVEWLDIIIYKVITQGLGKIE